MFRANKKFCNLNNYKKDFKHTYILTADSSREIICTTSIIIVKYSIKKDIFTWHAYILLKEKLWRSFYIVISRLTFHLRSMPHKSPRNAEPESFIKVTFPLFLIGTLWTGGGGTLQSLGIWSSSSLSILNLFWAQLGPLDPTPFVSGALHVKDEEDPLDIMPGFDETWGDFGKPEGRPFDEERTRFPLLLLLKMLTLLMWLIIAWKQRQD